MSLSMLSRAVRPVVAKRAFSSISINQVARVGRVNVGNEENALKADAFFKDAKKAYAALPGFVKMNRTVCKSEWAYEVEIVFDSLDNFKAHMDSDIRAKELEKFGALLQDIGVKKEDVYAGARVYDEL